MILKAFSYEYFKKLKQFRKENIVFLNGCFDVIHQGHLRLINRARNWAHKNNHILIIGLNSDESVKKLNKSHPLINDEKNRAAVLEELGVDYVIIFDEETPSTLIMNIMPDVIYKGEQYKNIEFDEKELITSTSIQIFWDYNIPGLSTTNIYNKIKSSVLDDISKRVSDTINEAKI